MKNGARSVFKFGGSLGLTLPAAFVHENGLRPGQTLYALRARSVLLITPHREVVKEFRERVTAKARAARKRAAEAQEGAGRAEQTALVGAAAEIADAVADRVVQEGARPR